MKKHSYKFLTALLSALCLLCVCPSFIVSAADTDVILGDEQFEAYLPLLEDRRVALFTNHSGIVGDETDSASVQDGQQLDLIPFGQDGSGNEISYGQHILDALEMSARALPDDAVRYLQADISSLTADTGFVPQTSFREGITEIIRQRRKGE